MNREQAEKKARELLGGKLKLSGRLGNSQDYANNYYNQAIDKAIPIVADLLMREAELHEVIFTETHYKQSYKASQKRVEELEKLSSIRSEGIDNLASDTVEKVLSVEEIEDMVAKVAYNNGFYSMQKWDGNKFKRSLATAIHKAQKGE